MGLRIKSTRQFGHKIATLMAVFALVAQPMYGFVASQMTNAAPVPQVVHDSLLSTVPATNYPSTGIQAHTSPGGVTYHEFGDRVGLDAAARVLSTVEVTMSSWAPKSKSTYVDWCNSVHGNCNEDGFYYPVTLRVYDTGLSEVLEHEQSVFIPWLPVDHPHGGIAFNAVFDASAHGITLDDEAVFSVAYDTRTRGYDPTGIASPMDAVNVAWRNSAEHGTTTGSDPTPASMLSSLSTNPTLSTMNWGAPFNLSLRVTATTDSTAPIVKVNLNREKFVNTGAFVNQDKNPELQASDDNLLDRVEMLAEGADSPRVWYVNNSSSRRANISFLGDGKYTITAYDVTGSASKPFIINLDSTNPETTLVTPTGLAGSIFTVSGVAEDNMALNRVYVQLVNRDNNTRYGGTTINLIPQGAGPFEWSRTYNAADLDLPAGRYAAHVSVVDRAGNTSSAGWSDNFVLDKTAPRITVKDDFVGDKDANVFSEVSFKLYDAQGVDYFTLNGVMHDRSNSEWSDANFQNIKNDLLEGDNTFILYDVAGNSTEYSFVYDTTAPTATFTHSNNNDSRLVNTDVTSTLHASEPIKTPSGWTPVAGSNSQKFTKVSSVNNKGNITLTDVAGNKSTVFFEVKRIDKTAPVFNVSNGDVFTAGSVDVVATEANIQSISVNGTGVTYTGDKPNYLVTISGDGVYEVVARDKAGNVSTVTFEIDTIAPQVVASAVAPSAGSFTTSLNGITDAVRYQWTYAGVDGRVVNFANQNSLSTAVTVPAFGTYSFMLTAWDAAGNFSTFTVPVTFSNFILDNGDRANLSAGNQDAADEEQEEENALPLTPLNPGIVAVLDQDANATDTEGDVLAEEDNTQDNLTGNGEVLADEDEATDEGCAKFLGLCWYWWIPIVGAIVAVGFIIRGMLREDDELPPARRQ